MNMDYDDEKLVEEFIKKVPVKKSSNTKSLFAISFIGLPGSGKSFVANKISERLGLYISSSDKIRRFFNDLGFDGSHPLQDVLEKVSRETSKYLFEHKISHIIDADLIRFHEIIKTLLKDWGGELCILEIICPENIVLERIKNRQKHVESKKEDNFSRGTIEDYFERKKIHGLLKKPEYFFSMDTSLDVDSQIDLLILKLKQNFFIS